MIKNNENVRIGTTVRYGAVDIDICVGKDLVHEIWIHGNGRVDVDDFCGPDSFDGNWGTPRVNE